MTLNQISDDKKRIYLLLTRIDSKKITGRIKLQKIVYLIQQYLKNTSRKPFSYKFSYYNYGPFSKTLAVDITDLTKQTNVISENSPESEDKPWEYEFIGNDIDSSITVNDYFGVNDQEFKNLVNELNRCEYKLLELTSAIVYINNLAPKHNKEDIKNTVKSLKPHLMDRFDEAYKLAEKFTHLT
jgi:uncharacterized protein YwgA